MRTHHLISGCLFALVLFLSNISAQERQLVASQLNNFAAQLMSKVQTRKGNIVLCPTAIASNLLALSTEASGETKNELLFTLTLPKDFCDNVDNLELIKKTNQGLESYSSLWLEQTLNINKSTPRFLKNMFALSLESAPLAKNPLKSRELINYWISKASNNRIEAIIPKGSLTTSTKMLMACAANGAWQWQPDFVISGEEKFFTEHSTATPDKKKSIPVKMLQASYTGGIQIGKNFKAVCIPLKDSEYEAIILLPNFGVKLSDCAGAWRESDDWFSGWKQIINLKLPVFSFTFNSSLRKDLTLAGISDVFSTKNANFSKLSDEKISLQDYIYYQKISVNQSGINQPAPPQTKSAAKTQIQEGGINFIVNRPFIFMVRHTKSYEIVLIGRFSQPPVPAASLIKKKEEEAITSKGYGPWKFGMRMDEVKKIGKPGPYRLNRNGGLKCLHAPWKKFYDKRAELYFDADSRLTEIRLWLCTDTTKEKALGFAKAAEKYLVKINGKSEEGIAKRVLTGVYSQDEDQPSLSTENTVKKPGQPRQRLSVLRHPQFGWFVYINFYAF